MKHLHAGSKQGVSESPIPDEALVLVIPAVLPKLHTLTQAMLRCRGSHVFKVGLNDGHHVHLQSSALQLQYW